MSDYAGRNVLITGAASGIGRLLAQKIAAEGARVILWDVESAALERTLAQLGTPLGRHPLVEGFRRLETLGFGRFVPGARPDVAAAFPSLPTASSAGWGFLLLTDMLPHQISGAPVGGQGPFTLHVTATMGNSLNSEISRIARMVV